MIVTAPASRCLQVLPQTAEAFEAMLPSIYKFAGYAFRKVRSGLREEMLADVAANAYAAFVRLVERGLEQLAYATALARYAVRQVWAGRQLGVRQNSQDVLSRHAQRQRGFQVQPFREQNSQGNWEELVVEDRKATPAEIAAFKVDFSDWLKRLKRFPKQVALQLAAGETPTEVARYFQLSLGRISQIRRELWADWNAFQAMPEPI